MGKLVRRSVASIDGLTGHDNNDSQVKIWHTLRNVRRTIDAKGQSAPFFGRALQDTCRDPAVLVGGGFITCEVAAAIATHCPGMPLAMVLPSEEIMSRTGFGKDVCRFYERQLARVRRSAVRLAGMQYT